MSPAAATPSATALEGAPEAVRSAVTVPVGPPTPVATSATASRAADQTPDAALTPSASSVLEPRAVARGVSTLLRTSSVTLPELARLGERAALPEERREVERELPRQSRETQRTTEGARRENREATRWFDVVDIEYGVRLRYARLKREKQRIDARVVRAAHALQQVDAAPVEAARAPEEAVDLQLDSKARAELRQVVAKASIARRKIRRSEASVPRLQAAHVSAVEEVEYVLDAAAAEGSSLGRELMRKGPSLVEMLSKLGSDPTTLHEAVSSAVTKHVGSPGTFLRSSGQRLFGQACLGVAVLLSLSWMRTRARRPDQSVHADRSETLLHPLAESILVTMAASGFVHAEFPTTCLRSVSEASVRALRKLELES